MYINKTKFINTKWRNITLDQVTPRYFIWKLRGETSSTPTFLRVYKGIVWFMYLLGYGLPEESCSKDVPEHLVQLNKLYRPAVLRRVVLQVKRSTHLINFVHKLLDELFFFRKSMYSPNLPFYSSQQRDKLS